MDQFVMDVIRDRLSRVFEQIEHNRQITVDEHVRSFISNVVLESLFVRESEWENKVKLDPNSSQDAEQIARIVEGAVMSTTEEAETYKPRTGSEHILLVGVLQQIQKRWCGIFPFCR